MNTASQVTVTSHFPLRFFESTRIPHRILAKSLIPKIPFQTSLCSELSRATHIKKGENQGVIILVKLKWKYILALLIFLYLKKTEFDKVNVSSPYIMMWNTVNESWFLVKYLIKIKMIIVWFLLRTSLGRANSLVGFAQIPSDRSVPELVFLTQCPRSPLANFSV